MRVLIITQNDVFYLPDFLAYLLENFPAHSNVVAGIVLDVSPFGKRATFHDKVLKTLRIFGPAFFITYGARYARAWLRGRDVKTVLHEHGVPLLTIDGSVNAPESLRRIAGFRPDLIVSIAGNQIFKRALIDLPAKGVLNLHTALLPKYRGLMPTFWVLKNDESETGVSVFFVDEGIDAGPIVVQKRIPIDGMSQEQLISITKRLGMDAIIEAVDRIERDDYVLMPNADAEKSYYSFPTREDVREFRRRGKRFY